MSRVTHAAVRTTALLAGATVIGYAVLALSLVGAFAGTWADELARDLIPRGALLLWAILTAAGAAGMWAAARARRGRSGDLWPGVLAGVAAQVVAAGILLLFG